MKYKTLWYTKLSIIKEVQKNSDFSKKMLKHRVQRRSYLDSNQLNIYDKGH